MKMSDVEFQADNSKATFYYSAEDRIDFRELIKSLAGEFKVPGDYAFSRTEPLSEIIIRAGGLTTTAYPLGAVLERKSIKAQEKDQEKEEKEKKVIGTINV